MQRMRDEAEEGGREEGKGQMSRIATGDIEALSRRYTVSADPFPI